MAVLLEDGASEELPLKLGMLEIFNALERLSSSVDFRISSVRCIPFRVYDELLCLIMISSANMGHGIIGASNSRHGCPHSLACLYSDMVICPPNFFNVSRGGAGVIL